MSDVFDSPGGTTPWSSTSGTTAITNTSSFALMAANGLFLNYIESFQAWNNSGTISTVVKIMDGSTVLAVVFLPATTAALPVVPAVIKFDPPLYGTVNTAMNIACVTTGANVFYNAQGFVGRSSSN